MFLRPLLAYDASPPARHALKEAVGLAHANNARLTVLTVFKDPVDWGVGAGYATPVNHGALQRDTARSYTDLLRAAIDDVPHDLSVTSVMKRGTAGSAILDQVEAGDHDLVIIGSRGRGELQSFLLRSVSHRVLRASPVPVLVVHVPQGMTTTGRSVS